jgi:hypothetical protein
VIGLTVGLIGGLISFAASPSVTDRANSPTDNQRGDRDLADLVTVTFALMLPMLVQQARSGGLWLYGLKGPGALLGSLGWLGKPLNTLLVILVGLLIGLLIAPMVTRTCWTAFGVASLWLWMRRRLPLRLMGFLDDAYRLGLLRITGPVYQFRHAVLQDHLARSGISAGVTPPVPRTIRRTLLRR